MPEPEPPAARTGGEPDARPARHYPEFYERAVPMALAAIGVALIVILVIILIVVLKVI